MAKFNTIADAMRPAVAAVALAGSLIFPVTARAASVGVTASATILPHASLQVLAQPSAIVVTPQDLARGWVDVPARARVAIKSNTSGYQLVFAGEGADFVRQVHVSGLGADVQMGAGGGVITRSAPGRGMSTSVLEMGFRFELAAGTQQGVYPWPIQLSVVPI